MSFEGDLKYALGFNLVEGIGGAKLRALQGFFGGLKEAWHASRWELERLGLDRRALSNLLKVRDELDLDREIGRIDAAGVTLLTWNSPQYPELLQKISFPPPLLYMRGRLQPVDSRAVAVVGTRRLTSYGRQIAQELARGLAGCGLTVVSGLARGIDSVVHECTLDHGGRTVAVLGSGADVIYPPENRQLVSRIINDNQGAILSEYPLGTKPQAKNFPPRNRIVSGMTWGTVIIEGDIKSGAMITARFAIEQDRDVFAVPGPINSPVSRGPHWLIQQGAKLVTGLDDILEELQLGTQTAPAPPVQLTLPESAEEAALLPHLSHAPQHIDMLCRLSQLPAPIVGSTLAILELKGVVRQQGHLAYALR
ncbi:MAG: DNA-processing protein DprA [Ardenticatenaceae bacterium]|nr:DNA-processing protein DprA [Ardenticatenaceae bacterium]